MKIGVLIKQVPDTETRIRIADGGMGVDESTVKWIVNPFDEYALEEALRIKDSAEDKVEVVVVSVGPSRVLEVLRSALALGADSAIRIDTEGIDLDCYLVAKLLARVISEEGFDIVFAGKKSVDDECSQIVQRVASIINWPSVGVIEEFRLEEGVAVVQRPSDSGRKDILEVDLPAIFGCEKDLNIPRYASLPGIIRAKSKPIREKCANDIIGTDSYKVELKNFEIPPARKPGRRIESNFSDAAEALVEYLNDEIKII